MLALRIATAAVLAPAFLAGLWLLSAEGFALLVGTIAVLGALEWAYLSGLGRFGGIVYATLLALAGWFLWAHDHTDALLVLGAAWWCVATVLVIAYPRGRVLWQWPSLRAVMGLPVLLPGWAGFVSLQGVEGGAWLLLSILLLVWAADAGAYFAGRAWGRRKLAVAVSPSKTWEGVAGGLVLALFVGLGASALAGIGASPGFWALAVTLLVVALSIIGDLTESLLKRSAGVKDSGQLLPGHGGVLDRIDSLLAAMPIAALVFLYGGVPFGGAACVAP